MKETILKEALNYIKMQDITFPKPKVHLFVCVNQRHPDHPTPSCRPTITPEQINKLKLWVSQQGLARDVYVTKSKCLGFCDPKFSVAVIYPKGRFVKYLKIEELKELIMQELNS
jgi:predicted metal-binding protein